MVADGFSVTDYSPDMHPGDRRIVIVGGPMAGKSTLARQLGQARGFPVFCGDPRSKSRELAAGTTYLPEGLDWSRASEFVASQWLSLPAPWIVEGHVTARALRKLLVAGGQLPDRVLWLPRPHPQAYLASHQRAVHDAVAEVWAVIAPELVAVTATVALDEPAWDPLAGVHELARQLDCL